MKYLAFALEATGIFIAAAFVMLFLGAGSLLIAYTALSLGDVMAVGG